MNTDFSQPYNPQAAASARPAGKLSATRLKKGLPWLYGLILPAVMGLCLYSYEKGTLFRIQELNLFLPDAAFYHGFSAYPGGTLEWMACFLTQFFYYPALGVALLVVLWAALCGVTRSAFRLSAAGSILMPLLPAALLAGIVQMGYFIYYIKLPGYAFVASLGILLALSAVWAFSRLSRRPYLGYAWMAVWTLAGYPLFGAYALAGTFYMAVLCWRMPGASCKSRLVPTALCLLLLVGTPLAAWHFYAQTNISAIYAAALPSFDAAGEVFGSYRIPYYIII